MIGLEIIFFLMLMGNLIPHWPFKKESPKDENLPIRDEDTDVNRKSKNSVKETSVDHGKIVVALDIGTEYMGYAFSCQTRKNQIYTAQNSGSYQCNRMPTAVLLNPDLSLNSVGFSAVGLYSKLVLNKLHSEHIYTRNFKLRLYDQEEVDSDQENVDSVLHDKVSVEDILCHVICFLKRHALETTNYILSSEKQSFEENIEWVLTTPNNQKAEKILSKAAKKAELGRFDFVIESNAAAWFCQRTQPTVTLQNKITNMSNRCKFIIADLGAGKTDICIYEMMNGSLQKSVQFLKKIGGNSVNEEFECFMETICGSKSWNDFKMSHAFDYEKLMYSFEEEKVKFGENTECVVLTMHQYLLAIVETNENVTLKERIEAKHELLDKAEIVQDKLIIDRRQMEEYFTPSLWNIRHTLEDVVTKEVCNILVFGGYSSSAFVRKELIELSKSFKDVDMAFVQHPDMVVLKGAVLKGLEQ